MSGLTYVLLSGGMLAALWLFVLPVMGTIRTDRFGPQVKRRPGKATPVAAVPPAAPAASRPAPHLAPAPSHPATPPERAQSLVFLEGPLRGRRITLGSQPITIGRSSENGLVLRDDYTSTYHARLFPARGGWMIEDLGSTNGTFVAGRRVSGSTAVGARTPIKVGSTVMELQV